MYITPSYIPIHPKTYYCFIHIFIYIPSFPTLYFPFLSIFGPGPLASYPSKPSQYS